MNDSSPGLKVVDQVLLFKKLNSEGNALVAQTPGSDEALLYVNSDGSLLKKVGSDIVDISGQRAATSSEAEALSATSSITPSVDRYSQIARRDSRTLKAGFFKGKLGQSIASLLVWGDSYGQFVFFGHAIRKWATLATLEDVWFSRRLARKKCY